MYSSRGIAYGLRGDFDKAIADCTEAIRLDPKNTQAYQNRGVAYGKKGEKAKAEEDFAQTKKLEDKPK
jgi:Flp pilus assembly protein TadD